MWPLGGRGQEEVTEGGVKGGSEASIDSCPVDEGTRQAWLAQSNTSSSSSPSSASSNASSAYAFLSAKPDSHATITSDGSKLSKERVTSSIPRWSNREEKSDESSASSSNWVYPSPNQFFSAMARKNHNPRADDMNVVVPIHNAVNERAWNGILEWERVADESAWKKCGGPKLVSFKGRPKDVTWKAWSGSLLG
jgi:cytochrome c heme-lyase